jgi:hypothetical protein
MSLHACADALTTCVDRGSSPLSLILCSFPFSTHQQATPCSSALINAVNDNLGDDASDAKDLAGMPTLHRLGLLPLTKTQR